MAKFDFDKEIDRRNSSSLKWDIYKGKDILPMWVADMDFASPPAVLDALKNRVDHGVFGYTLPPNELLELVVDRLKTKYNWHIDPQWIVWLPGLVTGLNVMCRAIGNSGDKVLTNTPIYPPFLSSPVLSQRELIKSPMKLNGERWIIDFDDLEKGVKDCGLYLFCNPHNPAGRIFCKEELLKIAEICERTDTIICSDEIHCDLLLDENKSHIPLASLSPEIANRTVTLMAPSKTWNIAGLGCSFAIIPNQKLRGQFNMAKAGIVPFVNTLGYTAALAAYKYGQDWLDELLYYLRSNSQMVFDRINALPGLSTTKVEATYLAWIDTHETGIENPHTFFEDAGVGLSNGKEFDANGFLRLNFGCTKNTLDKALDRIEKAIN
jgi:cysteine-S-conjugate beta-lyase